MHKARLINQTSILRLNYVPHMRGNISDAHVCIQHICPTNGSICFCRLIGNIVKSMARCFSTISDVNSNSVYVYAGTHIALARSDARAALFTIPYMAHNMAHKYSMLYNLRVGSTRKGSISVAICDFCRYRCRIALLCNCSGRSAAGRVYAARFNCASFQVGPVRHEVIFLEHTNTQTLENTARSISNNTRRITRHFTLGMESIITYSAQVSPILTDRRIIAGCFGSIPTPFAR